MNERKKAKPDSPEFRKKAEEFLNALRFDIGIPDEKISEILEQMKQEILEWELIGVDFRDVPKITQ